MLLSGTSIVFADDKWDETYAKCEAGLEMVKKWLDEKLLTLNIKKQQQKNSTFNISSVNQPKDLNN